MNESTRATILAEASVPLRSGPPTQDELLVYYPAKFSWEQLKTFVNSGDLGLLKRDKKLQERYLEWVSTVEQKHGSIVNYLVNHRLRWGQPDTQSLLQSSLRVMPFVDSATTDSACDESNDQVPAYFTCDVSPKYISVIQNDWPYSVPADVEHSLIWTKLPIFHPKVISESVKVRIDQDGLWGFTGNESPPPSPSILADALGALSEWGVTVDKMIKSQPPTPDEAVLIERAGKEVHKYVQNRWPEPDWETAWFVNPPRLQSVPGLAHIHVFARRK